MDDAPRAERLLASLRLPDEASTVLRDRRFWNPVACRAYLDACDRAVFRAPKDGLRMARLGSHLVHLLPLGHRRRDLLVHALAVLASAFRATGQLFEAEGVYAQAFALAGAGTIDPLEIADLHRRHAVLLLERRRFDDALASAERAVEIFTSLAPRGRGEYCLGAALLQRGAVRQAVSEAGGVLADERDDETRRLAVRDFGLALLALDPERNERQHYAVVANLAHVLTASDDPAVLNEGARRLRQARSSPMCAAGTIACYKLRITEATLLARLGAVDAAEELLRDAREGFDALGAALEVVQASVDLAALYRHTGRLAELTTLVDDTVRRCRTLGANAELLALLATWGDALDESRSSSDDARQDARQIERRVRDALASS